MLMKLPRDVQRCLTEYRYHPIDDPEFGTNFLARRISLTPEHGAPDAAAVRTLATICAVPRGSYTERVDSLQTLARWLETPRVYTPPGRFVPTDISLFNSNGVVRAELDHLVKEGERVWQSYVFVGRDGYMEAGQNGGFRWKGRTYFQYVPMVAWIERYWGLLAEMSKVLQDVPRYHVALNIAGCSGAELATFGDHWLDPASDDYRFHNDRVPSCIEDVVQISRPYDASMSVDDIGRWFAERIANAFGFGEARCFNHENTQGRCGPAGTLPTNRLEFR